MVRVSSCICARIMPAGFELGAPRVTRLRRITFSMRKKRKKERLAAASAPLESRSPIVKQKAMIFGKVVTMSIQVLKVQKKLRFEFAKIKSLTNMTAKNKAATKSAISIFAMVEAFLIANSVDALRYDCEIKLTQDHTANSVSPIFKMYSILGCRNRNAPSKRLYDRV